MTDDSFFSPSEGLNPVFVCMLIDLTSAWQGIEVPPPKYSINTGLLEILQKVKAVLAAKNHLHVGQQSNDGKLQCLCCWRRKLTRVRPDEAGTIC